MAFTKPNNNPCGVRHIILSPVDNLWVTAMFVSAFGRVSFKADTGCFKAANTNFSTGYPQAGENFIHKLGITCGQPVDCG
jgi:hypothetical protein